MGGGTGAGAIPVLTPIAFSDFENGVYSINGVSKTRAEMWERDTDHEGYFGSGLIEPVAQIVPGTGFTVTDDDVTFAMLASTAELTAALNVTSGVVAVFDYTLDEVDTQNTPRIYLEVSDWEYWNGWWWMHNGTHGIEIGEYNWPTPTLSDEVEPSPAGAHITAVTLNPNFFAYSLDGDPAYQVAGDPHNMDNPGATTPEKVYLIVGTAHGTGPLASTATIRSATFYPSASLAQLAVLSGA